jgi:hypothetical protein
MGPAVVERMSAPWVTHIGGDHRLHVMMVPMRWRLALLISLFAPLGLAGCGSDPKVVRVYDGRIVEGPYVPSEAYTAYLEGTLAEEAGDLKNAIVHYKRAANADDEDPEVETRLGDAQCRADPKDRAADEAFARAARSGA